MRNNASTFRFSKIFLPALLFAATALTSIPSYAENSVAEGPLLTSFFKNLKEGKKQTVLFYGTSLTKWGDWTKQTSSWLDQKYPNQITYLNTAEGGTTSNWGVEHLQTNVLDHHPDVVFIEFQMNEPCCEPRPAYKITVERSISNLDTMVKGIRSGSPQTTIVIQTMNCPAGEPAISRKNLGEYCAAWATYARENKLCLIDNYPDWLTFAKDHPADLKKWMWDDLHPDYRALKAVTMPNIIAFFEKSIASVNVH